MLAASGNPYETNKRLQELGQASRDSWISRLYNHVMGKQDHKDQWAMKTGLRPETIKSYKSAGNLDGSPVGATRSASSKPPILPPLKSGKGQKNKDSGGGSKQQKQQQSDREEANVNYSEEDTDNLNNTISSDMPPLEVKVSLTQRPSTAGSIPNNTDPIQPITQGKAEANRKISSSTTPGSSEPGRKATTPSKPKSHKNNDKMDRELKLLPAQLASSPYIPDKERANYKIIVTERIKELAKAKKALSSEGPRDGTRSSFPRRSEGRSSSDAPSWLVRKPGHPYASHTYGRNGHPHKYGDAEAWKSHFPKSYSVVEMEKKAKEVSEKAMKVSFFNSFVT